MKETALVVMAAGIGSRYGKGIKQLEHVGPSGEIIMDYAIYDAMEAGFNKWYLLSGRIWKKILRRLSATGLPKRSR